MHAHPRLIAIAGVLVALLASPAAAEDRAQAEVYFRLGEKAYQAQDFEAAAAQFEEAYKNYELPEIAFSAAQSYRRLYRIKPKPADVARAVELYRSYLSKVTNGGRVADAADALAEMQHELDKLLASGAEVSPELAKEHTRLSINVSLDQEAPSPSRGMQEVAEQRTETTAVVRATLDGQPVKTLSFINVAPGAHAIVVTADGYFTGNTRIAVGQGQTQIANVQLVPRPARVTLATESGARVAVNGHVSGTTPLAPLELPAGKHVITLSMRGRLPVARELVVDRGAEVTLRAPLAMTWRRRTVPWLLAAAGVSGAVMGVSVTFTWLRDDAASDLLQEIRGPGNATEAQRQRYDRLREARDRWRTASYVSGAGLVALAGAAAVLYYTDNPSTDGVRVEPMTVPAGGGAAIAGRF